MHKKCMVIVRIVRIVSDFWHNSGKLSDNSELREFSDSLVRVREGVKCVKSNPRRVYFGRLACACVWKILELGGKVRNLKFPQNKKKIENSENLNYKIVKN